MQNQGQIREIDTVEVEWFNVMITKEFWPECSVVLTEHPTDYPDKCVGRLWIKTLYGEGPTKFVIMGDTIQELRDKLPQWLVRFDPAQGADPCVKEFWTAPRPEEG